MYRKLTEQQHKFLSRFMRYLEVVPHSCPNCQSEGDWQGIGQTDAYEVWECMSCGHKQRYELPTED